MWWTPWHIWLARSTMGLKLILLLLPPYSLESMKASFLLFLIAYSFFPSSVNRVPNLNWYQRSNQLFYLKGTAGRGPALNPRRTIPDIFPLLTCSSTSCPTGGATSKCCLTFRLWVGASSNWRSKSGVARVQVLHVLAAMLGQASWPFTRAGAPWCTRASTWSSTASRRTTRWSLFSTTKRSAAARLCSRCGQSLRDFLVYCLLEREHDVGELSAEGGF